MCEKRVMVHFDEANLDLHAYVDKQSNKSEFIRECIRARMEKDTDLKKVVIEALKEFVGGNTISLVAQSDPDMLSKPDDDISDVANFFEEY